MSKRDDMLAARKRVMELAAERYAAADRTDPFAFRRTMAHLKCGVASYAREGENGEQVGCYYDAQGYAEPRSYMKSDGDTVEYSVPAWRNMVRP